jgi:hypothetical protein
MPLTHLNSTFVELSPSACKVFVERINDRSPSPNNRSACEQRHKRKAHATSYWSAVVAIRPRATVSVPEQYFGKTSLLVPHRVPKGSLFIQNCASVCLLHLAAPSRQSARIDWRKNPHSLYRPPYDQCVHELRPLEQIEPVQQEKHSCYTRD